MNTSQNKTNKKSKYSVFAIVFILVGALIIAFYFKSSITYNNKSKEFIAVDAEVINHKYEDGKLVGVILEYKVDEDTYKITVNLHDDNIKAYGTTVVLKYNPDKPEEIIVANQKVSLWLPVAGLSSIVIGVSIFIVILLYKIKMVKKHYTLPNEAPVYNPDLKPKKKEKKKNQEETINTNINNNNYYNTNINNETNPIIEEKNEPVVQETQNNNTIVSIPFEVPKKIDNTKVEIPQEQPKIIDTSFIVKKEPVTQPEIIKEETITQPETIKKPEIHEEEIIIKEDINDPNDQKLKRFIETLDNSNIPSFIPKKK